MNPIDPINPIEPCLHCEQAPQANLYRLCWRCASFKGLRNIYKKRKGWTPAWDAHLQGLVARANKRLPLFPEGMACELPPRPAPGNPVQRKRRKRKPSPRKPRQPARHICLLGENS